MRFLALNQVLTVIVTPILSSTYAQLQCTPSANLITPSDALGPFYVDNSEMTDRIAPEDILSDPNQRLFVYGKVFDSNTCEGIPSIVVEAWYAGPEDGGFYQNDEFRGQVTTSDVGVYNFTLAFPAQYPSRPILHIHFRLSTVFDQELLVTQMYFYGTGSGYVTDRSERTLQAVDTTLDATGARQAEFNFFIESIATGGGSGSNGLLQRIFAFITSIFATLFNIFA